MTKGDRDRLRAEIAGRAAQGMLAYDADWADTPTALAVRSVGVADALLDRLGLSEDSEQEAIRKEAERRRGAQQAEGVGYGSR